jgi:hypothetical protein
MLEAMVEPGVQLLPARVLATAGRPGFVQIALAEQETTWARLALAVPYAAEPGDEVLLICNSSQAYVIGVLAGRGTTTLRVPGDLRLEAPCGEIHISAAKRVSVHSGRAIELCAPRASMRFERLNVLVGTLVQRLTNAFTWASGLIQSKSRRSRCVTEEGWLVRAGRAHLKTQDNVHINGKTIHLG